ncbi:preprotein translocase subunit SecA, partial [Amycolatopsis japonica]
MPAAVVAAQLGSTTPDPGVKSLKDEASDGPVEGFVSVAEWGAVRDSVPQVRHRGERRGPATEGGESVITQLRFGVRKGSAWPDKVAPAQGVTELQVPVALVSKPGGVDGNARRALADAIQAKLDEKVNGRYRLPGGDQLHVVIDARVSEAPPRPGWERDGARPVPVEVGVTAGGGQLSWRVGDTDAAVGKLLRFIGVESGAEGQGIRLGAADLAAIEATIRDTAGDAKEIPPSADPGRPDVVAGPAGTVLWPARFTGLGTSWARDGNGWYRAEGEGTVPGPEGPVVVREGARAVFDAGGEARYVVLKDEEYGLGDDLSYQVVEAGLSVERGLDGQWSAPRSRAGEVRARKMTEAEVREAGVMTLDDGSKALLPAESERVVDRHGGVEKVVAYRQLKDPGGTWLSRPRVFVPDGEGGWVQHAADAVAYEGWLASANRASKAARTLWDIAARSGPEIPKHRRLTELSGPELRNLYGRGPEADAFAAVFELIRRNKGIALRWTQVESVHAFGEGEVVNMAAGEGKSWLFFAHAAVNAMRPGVDAVQMTTTRGILADREMPVYVDLLGKLGVDVHRLNQDDPPPGPREGRPTVYVGTAEDVGFTYLRRDILPGQETKEDPVLVTVSIDEIDEALVYSNAQYILSEGVQGAASAEVLAQVEAAHDLVQGVGSDGGWLTEADFGRREGQAGGPARLTDSGRNKVEQRLGHALSDEEVTRVNMAAAARWEYKENVHYVLHEGKIYIIDQTTHQVMFNPATSSESRWNGGLAQAVEYKHELQVRSDSGGSKVVTARELLAKKEYGQKTGASGTANGHGMEFAQQGLSPMVRDIDRYYEPRLTIHDDVVAVDEAAKLRRLAQDVQAMHGPEGTGRPQLILAARNDQVAILSNMLTELGVPHDAIDAKFQLEKGVDFEEEANRLVAAADRKGGVLLGSMVLARGVNPPDSMLLRVTAHSGIRDIDIQAENRTGRSGSAGEAVYYSSPQDELYQLSQNPDVQLAITTYTDAVTDGDTHAIADAQQGLRDLVKVIQTGSGHPTIDRTTARPNAPPTGHDTHPRTRGDEPETRPPRERRDSLFDDDQDTVAVPDDVLDTAQTAFIEQLDDWRADRPGVIVPAAVGIRLNEDFLNQFRDAYTAGAGQQDWRDWLKNTAPGLHDTFDHAIPVKPGKTTPSDQPETRPPHEPPAAPEHQDPPLDDTSVVPAEALDIAQRAFSKQFDDWRAARPDVVIPADEVIRLRDTFFTGFQAAYTAPAGAGQQDWRDWLVQAASGLHDTFDQAILTDTTSSGAVREWPFIPSELEEARDWVYYDGGLSQGRFGKSPAKDFEPFIQQATKIVSLSHRVPVWIEQPDLDDVDAVRLNSAVKDLIAKYLANGWSEHDAGKLSAELAVKLGTSRGMPGNPVPLPGGARTDGIPEQGEPSNADSTPAGKAVGKPVIPLDLVGWRPARDENGRRIGPPNLLAYLRTYWLWREVEPRLRDGTLGKAQFGAKSRRLGPNLPAELRELVWQEAELDLVASVQAWLVDILNEKNSRGGHRYPPEDVAALSGGLVDARVVWDLREGAQADWHGRLRDGLTLELFGVFDQMLAGFVDAAVRVRSGVLPSVRVELYVAKEDADSRAARTLSSAKRMVRDRLARYPSEAVRVSAEVLLDQVDIQVRVVQPGDSRIDTVLIQVDGQRPPGGLYDPVAYQSVDAPDLAFRGLRQAQAELARDEVDREGPVFERARVLVNQYNLDPSEFVVLAEQYNLDPSEKLIGSASLQSLYETRYEAAVTMVAWELHRYSHNEERAERAADTRAAVLLADSVGVLRQNGIWSGVPGQDALSGFVAEPGWLVQVEAGVGRVMAGLVLGDAHSSIGKAARWLRRERGSRREPGVFAVVVPDHSLPDVEIVAWALDRAGWNKRDKLRLFLCYQPGLEKLAQDLADLYNVEVFYPKEKLWLGVAGGAGRPAARVEKLEYVDGRPRLTLLEDGTGWAGRKPGGDAEEEGTAYVLTAPARAPRLGLRQEVHLGSQADSSSTADVLEGGESSRDGAARAGKPQFRIPLAPAELVAWRPAEDGSRPRTLPEALPGVVRKFMLERGIANRLRDSDFDKGLDENVKHLLEETMLGQFPRELLEMIRYKVQENPVSDEYFQAWAEAWVKSIMDDTDSRGYRYLSHTVERISGGWVDEWVVKQLRNSRTDWKFQLNDDNTLLVRFGYEVAASMLEGFVDAVAHADPGESPRLLGVRYVAERGGEVRSLVRSAAPSKLTAAWSGAKWAYSRDPLRRLIRTVLKSRLEEHTKRAPWISMSVGDLLAQTDIRTRAVPAGDPRIGLVHLHVDGQQTLNEWDGLEIYDNPDDEAWPLHLEWQVAKTRLFGLDHAAKTSALEEARELVKQYNREPVEYTGQNPRLRELYRRHRRRYNAAVEIVAMSSDADRKARRVSDWVGLRRRHGVVGDVSGEVARPGSGWLVPVGPRVGVVEAGMVLGDLGSMVGQAARWLRREPGVFGVVVTGHAVPDLETVLKALEDAGWNGKDAVRFFLCYQEGLPKLVKGLANSFRGEVLYPGKQVWFGVAGGPAAGVGEIEYVDGKPQVKLADNGGGWLEEDRRGKPKPGTYVLPALEKAPPRLGLPRPLHLGPQAPEMVGESSRAGAARGGGTRPVGKVFAKPLPRAPMAPAELVEWRRERAANGRPIGPQTLPEVFPEFLREAMREFILRRGIAYRLRPSDFKRGLGEDVKPLVDTPVGDLSPELLEVVRQEVVRQTQLDPMSFEYAQEYAQAWLPVWVRAWLKSIMDEAILALGYIYSSHTVATMSGGWVDPWVVVRLRSYARTDWTFELDGSGLVRSLDSEILWLMLGGFVDAALQAEPGESPRLLGVRYVAERTPGKLRSRVKSMAPSQLTAAWSAMGRVVSRDPLHRLIQKALEHRLKGHRERAPSITVSVRDLLAQTDIRTREVPAGDPRIGLVRLHVEGQQRPAGLYGFDVYDDPNKDSSAKYLELQVASGQLAGVKRDGAVFGKARELVDQHNREPVTYTGRNPLLRDLYAWHRARYEAAVTLVAAKIHDSGSTSTAGDEMARELSDWVGLRRPAALLGDLSEDVTRPGSGWLVPTSAYVGVVEAGMVLGDLGSMVGQAAQWLRREPGVFGVVVTSHAVPDLETLKKALVEAGWNGKDAVRLFLCYQEGLPELAAGLADSFGGTVFYAGEQVWFGVIGGPAARVGGVEYALDGKPRWRLADNGGGWFKEDRSGKPKPGTYVLPALEKAPQRLGLPWPLHLGPQAGSSVSGEGDSQAPVPEDVAGWRPAKDETGRPTGPQTLPAFVVERRVGQRLALAERLGAVSPGLRSRVRAEAAAEPVPQAWVDAWFERVVAVRGRDGWWGYPAGTVARWSGGLIDSAAVFQERLRLSPGPAPAELVAWRPPPADAPETVPRTLKAFVTQRGIANVEHFLEFAEDGLGGLPAELLRDIRDQVTWDPDPVPADWVREWVHSIVAAKKPTGRYYIGETIEALRGLAFSVDEIAEMSGGWVDSGTARQARTRARVSWEYQPPRWDRSLGFLRSDFASYERGKSRGMVEGFVDAAVPVWLGEVRRGVMPRVRGVLFVEAGAEATAQEFRSLVGAAVRSRLKEYHDKGVATGLPVEDLLALVDIQPRVRPSGHEQLGGAQLHVEGQRKLTGLYGPEAYTSPDDPLPDWRAELITAREDLEEVDRSHEVFVRARKIMLAHNQPPRLTIEDAPTTADRAHRDRFGAGVDIIAAHLWRNRGDADQDRTRQEAEGLSRGLVFAVGWAREKGILGLGRTSPLEGPTAQAWGSPGAGPSTGVDARPDSAVKQPDETAGLVPADKAAAKPMLPADLVGWRPAKDGKGRPIGPQTLRDLLREYRLLREIVPWLRDGEPDMGALDRLLVGTEFAGRLPAELRNMVWQELGKAQLAELDDALLIEEYAPLFEKMKAGRGLPAELLNMVWKEVELDLIESIRAWLEDIMNKFDTKGFDLYSDDEVARLSGWLIDAWVVRDLRGVARANWHGWIERSFLSIADNGRVLAMLEGFVQAAVQAPPGELPSLRGVLYVVEGDADLAIGELRAWVGRTVGNVLAGYSSAVPLPVSAEDLQDRVDIRARVLRPNDSRLNTARLYVDKQRLPGGLYGPSAHDEAVVWNGTYLDDWTIGNLLPAQQEELKQQARELVNRYNQEPVRSTGPAPWLYRKHRRRYENAVMSVAEALHRRADDPEEAERAADEHASRLADWVGLRRRYGVLGGEWELVAGRGSREVADAVEGTTPGGMSGQDVRQGSV